MSMVVSDFVVTLDLAIGPAILVSGVGLLLLSMTNRFGRVMDLTRGLVPRITGADGARNEKVVAQLRTLARRARALRAAMTMAVVSLLCTVLLIVGLFISATYQCEMPSVAITLAACFAGSMLTLMAALVIFLFELNISLRALWLELPEDIRAG